MVQMTKTAFPIVLATAVLAVAGCTTTTATTTTSSSTAPIPSPSQDYLATDESVAHWSYETPNGPDHWGDVSEVCDVTSSSNQSPINISTTELGDAGQNDAEPVGDISVNYVETEFTIVNNGHTIEAEPEDLTANSVTIGSERYFLQQFHLHNPSEHTVDGSSAAMELHLVNKRENGALAVLGILLDEGAAHEPLAELFESMPAEETGDEHDSLPKTELNPSVLIPTDSQVFQYSGSLTTPPCSEGVLWNVFSTHATVSADQLSAFNSIFPDNHRPVTPLNGRTLSEVQVAVAQ